MKKTFETIFGNVTVRNAMFDVDGTTLEEGIELKEEDGELHELFGYRNIDELTIKEVEKIISLIKN